jgi:long-chain acyl-CoA synthetase
VAILADNSATWIAAYLAALRLGAVAVPLDTAYKGPQVHVVLANSGAKLIFATPRYFETAAAGARLSGASPPAVVLLSGAAEGCDGPEAWDAPRAGVPPVADVEPGDAAVMLYTSGTTADPKGVVLTHANLEAERAGAFKVVEVTASDAILGVLPLFHALAQMANLLLPLAVGARVVFLETVTSQALVGALAERGITIFACVPQFFYLIHQRVMGEVARKGVVLRVAVRALIGATVWLRDAIGWNPGRIAFGRIHRALGPAMRVLVTGGSRFDAAIGRDLYGLGFTILNAYGLTETSGGATIQRPGDRFTTSVGQPLEGVDVRIDNDEILLRGPIVMREYYGRPDATAEALQDGWLRTGDLGRLDDQGRLYITGRKKEIIVLSSGKNLYPEEIEAHYRQSVFIKELCILGLARPGEPAAERLHAVIVPDEAALREKGKVNVRDLVRFELETLAVQLPAHKRVLTYDVSFEPLPRTTTGKIRRHEVERRVQAAARAATSPTPGARTRLSEADRAWADSGGRGDDLAALAARLPAAAVRPDANLELDLGLDSMERVELLAFLEQRRGRSVSAEVRATIFTVRQLIDAVIDAPARGGAGGTGATEASADLAWDALLATPPEGDLLASLGRPKRVRAAVLYTALQAGALVARVLLRLRTSGLEHLPASGPFLVSPNHQAYLDGFFVAAALPYRHVRRLFMVGAAEYFESRLMRRLADAVNIVPVDPDRHLVTAMRAGAAGLGMNKVLMLFPEGERSIDGELKAFRKGAAILSAHTGAPIVPVALDGLYELWPRGRPFNWRGLLPWRAAPVTIRFGAPIRVDRADYAGGTAALKAAVARMFAEIRPAATAGPAGGAPQSARGGADG